MKQKNMKYKYLVVGLLCFFVSVAQAQVEKFSDHDQIPLWSQTGVYTLRYFDILSGNPDGSFAPNRTINRAEFCKMLIEATKTPLNFPSSASFPDVTAGTWFYPYVETAKAQGWVGGYPDGSFGPSKTINRAEVAKILSQAINLRVSDRQTSEDWFVKYFNVLEEQNLLPYQQTSNNIDGSVNPTRSEIAEQLYRMVLTTGLIEQDQIPELPVTKTEPISRDRSSEDPGSSRATNYGESTSLSSYNESGAGDLSVSKIKGISNVRVDKGQDNITALQINVRAEKGPVEISALQFRRIGNSESKDFKHAWVEINGIKVSDKKAISGDVLVLPFKRPEKISSGNTQTITLKVATSDNATSGSSTRFVLYLPEWIESNTKSKTGFFPFGGIDIEVR